MRRALGFDGHDPVLAEDGVTGLRALAAGDIELVVLDVSMPELDGLEVCRRIRSAGDDVPVLMLTARDAIAERVAGLDAGADDYVVKPFALDEFLARVRALGRRRPSAEGGSPAATPADALAFADVRMNRASFEVWRGDRQLQLTRTEYSLLELLLRNPRQVITRSMLFEQVWGFDFGPASNTHEVHLSALRRKLESAGEPRIVHTVRGVGYTLREPA